MLGAGRVLAVFWGTPTSKQHVLHVGLQDGGSPGRVYLLYLSDSFWGNPEGTWTSEIEIFFCQAGFSSLKATTSEEPLFTLVQNTSIRLVLLVAHDQRQHWSQSEVLSLGFRLLWVRCPAPSCFSRSLHQRVLVASVLTLSLTYFLCLLARGLMTSL